MSTQHASSASAHPTPVIALHCSGAGAGQWRQLGDTLGRAYEVLTPEHYGRESTGPWPGEHAFTLADEADEDHRPHRSVRPEGSSRRALLRRRRRTARGA